MTSYRIIARVLYIVTHDHCGLNEDVLGEEAHSRRIFLLIYFIEVCYTGYGEEEGDEMLVG